MHTNLKHAQTCITFFFYTGNIKLIRLSWWVFTVFSLYEPITEFWLSGTWSQKFFYSFNFSFFSICESQVITSKFSHLNFTGSYKTQVASGPDKIFNSPIGYVGAKKPLDDHRSLFYTSILIYFLYKPLFKSLIHIHT